MKLYANFCDEIPTCCGALIVGDFEAETDGSFYDKVTGPGTRPVYAFTIEQQEEEGKLLKELNFKEICRTRNPNTNNIIIHWLQLPVEEYQVK